MKYTNNKAIIACIIVSLLGIVSIAALEINEDIAAFKISEIDRKIAGENVIACGVVKSKSTSPSGTTFLTLSEKKSSIRIVFFKNEGALAENVSRGLNLCIKGNVQSYNGSIELIGKGVFYTAH